MQSVSTTKELFLDSLTRCERSPSFISDFYELFTSRSPIVREKFARTDLESQGAKLLQSLNTLASAVAGEPEALKELSVYAVTHSRHHLNITPDLYELWSTALIETVRRHDHLWSAQIEGAWNHTLETLVGYMIKRY